MTMAEYEQRKDELSALFLREKASGDIPTSMGWADWCWVKRIYPLTDKPDEKARRA